MLFIPEFYNISVEIDFKFEFSQNSIVLRFIQCINAAFLVNLTEDWILIISKSEFINALSSIISNLESRAKFIFFNFERENADSLI